MANPSSSSIEIKEASLYSVKGDKYNVVKAIAGFNYYEDIMMPFIVAELVMIDSGQNLIGNLPIQGGEKVVMRVYDAKKKEEFKYELYVRSVFNRNFTKSIQTYTLGLVSKEGLYNEGVRINEILSGSADQIIKKIVNYYLDSDKKVLSEPCKFKINLFPGGRKAQAIIASIQPKSVPQSSSTIVPVAEKEKSSVKTSLSSKTQKAAGSAGYLFFENSRGFNFKPIDFYYSDGSDSFKGDPPVATYSYKPIQREAQDGNQYVIEDYRFIGEIDLIEQLRMGIYSTHMVFYNFSTGAYEEYTYKLEENFNAMAHLGSQKKLGTIQSRLSERPCRIISSIIDHETWFNSSETASPEKKDGGTGKAPFPDQQKYYLAQSIGRRYFMDTQKMEIKIPGNYRLNAGDKIKVLLPNMVEQTQRNKVRYDEENSGLYLISKLAHKTYINSECITVLELIRDTSGMKEYSSKVKS